MQMIEFCMHLGILSRGFPFGAIKAWECHHNLFWRFLHPTYTLKFFFTQVSKDGALDNFIITVGDQLL
jgi:hypothetical protein